MTARRRFADGPLPSRAMDGPDQDRFGRILFLIVAGFLLLGFDSTLAAQLVLVTNVVLIVVAFRTTSLRTTMPRLAVLAGIGIAASMLGAVGDVGDWSGALAASGQVVLLGALVLATVGRVLRHDVVTGQTVAGAIAAYLLIGLAFSWLYFGLDVIDEDMFSLDSTEVWSYSEFSFVVLTTLGFGNEVPTSPFAGRVVALEALTGQVFLATFIARMVSMYGQRRGTAE